MYKNFSFDESDAKRKFQREIAKSSFPEYKKYMLEQVIPFLEENGHITSEYEDFLDYSWGADDDAPWFETKNYNFILHVDDNIKTVIRSYGNHLTCYIFIVVEQENERRKETYTLYRNCVVILHDAGQHDDDDIYSNVEKQFKDTIDFIKKRYQGEDRSPNLMFWNSSSLPRVGECTVEKILDDTGDRRFSTEISCSRPDRYWYALDEISILAQYIAKRKLQEIADKFIDEDFEIPYSCGGKMVGFKKFNDDDYGTHVILKDYNGKPEDTADLWRIRGEDFDRLYNFFAWRK